MIGRIAIENYKSIESLTLDLGRVTVLIGANGSGKSNILEAIALCSAAAANKLDNEFLFARGIRIPDDFWHMCSAFDINAKDEITVKMLTKEDGSELFDARVHINRGNNQIAEPDSDFEWWDAYVGSLLIDKDNESDDQEREKISNNIKDNINRKRQQRQQQFASNGLNTFMLYSPENSSLRNFQQEGQIQPLGIRGEGLLKLLTVLARDENYDRLNELQERLQLLDWFGDFKIGDTITFGERTLHIRDQYLDRNLEYFTQRSANEGFLFLLFYFALFVAKETPRFFAIDNIDTALNPKLGAELLHQLTELAEKYDKQVILTTHNPAVLDGLNLRDDDQRLFVVERDLEGRTKARRIEPKGSDGERSVRLSEAFLRGYIGGLPLNF